MSKRALIYARVSTEDQVEKYGLPAQLRACREFAPSLRHGEIMSAIEKGSEYCRLATRDCQTAACACMWCQLGKLLKTLAAAGIHSQKDLDERLRAIETSRHDKREGVVVMQFRFRQVILAVLRFWWHGVRDHMRGGDYDRAPTGPARRPDGRRASNK